MKKFICLLIALTLAGCNGSGGGSSTPGTEEQKKETVNIQEIDLSGTWLVRKESDAYNKENDDYLLTNIDERRIILNDTDNGVEFNSCERHGIHRPDTGVKSGNRLYLYLYEDGYEYDSGDFVRSWEEGDGNNNIIWKKSTRLIKLSDEVELDSGAFSLTSPVEISEESHVCVRSYYSTLSTDRSFSISIPLEDDVLSFDISYWGDIETKSYSYEEFNYDNQLKDLYIRDHNEFFYNITGEYYPYLTSGTVTFTEASEVGVSGSFSATSQEGHEYSGSFEAIF